MLVGSKSDDRRRAGRLSLLEDEYGNQKGQCHRQARPGIWLGKGIKYARGTKTSGAIFLHEGKSAAWSDGCIVCDRTEFLKMWNAISPNSQPHVLVKVSDE